MTDATPLPGAVPAATADRPPRRTLWAFLVWALVYALDQVTKVLAVAHLEPGVRAALPR